MVLHSLVRLAIVAVACFSSQKANAKQEWTCKRGEVIRKIEIEAEVYGRTPCKVVYLKPSESVPPREIGAAKNAFSFCESKAEEVALKLQNLDWECEREDS
jgi:hypothetical protein